MSYEAPVPRLVAAFKDSRRHGLAGPLGDLMACIIPSPGPGCVLVPIPLAPRRQKHRGFNQAALLAGVLSRHWGLPVEQPLSRRNGEDQQRGSGRAARRGQVSGAFDVDTPAPHSCVLVDDVLTTGSTLTAAARALRAAGAAQVGAVALARVVAVGRGRLGSGDGYVPRGVRRGTSCQG